MKEKEKKTNLILLSL